MTLSRLAARYATLAAPAFVPAPSLDRTGQVLILSFKISFRMCHPFGMIAAPFRFLRACAKSDGGNARFQNRVLIAFRNSQENSLSKITLFAAANDFFCKNSVWRRSGFRRKISNACLPSIDKRMAGSFDSWRPIAGSVEHLHLAAPFLVRIAGFLSNPRSPI